MLSLSRDDIDSLTGPLCSEETYRRKLDNYRSVERSCGERSELCGGMPIEMNLEPSGICNMRCSGCPRGRGRIKRTGLLPYATFSQVFTQIGATLCNIFISGFGEPLFNDDLPRMIALATRYGVSTVMNTNGTLLLKQVDALLDARLTLINVALDGAAMDSYHQYHQAATFESVVQGVERLRQRRDQRGLRYPFIEGQFIIREHSLGEINRLRAWAEGIGVERVKFKRPYVSMPGEEDRPAVQSVSEYLKRLGVDNVASTERIGWSPAECALPWDNILLSCTGQLAICCYDPHLKMQLDESGGTIDVARLWNGETIRRVRRWLSGREATPVSPCARCNRMPGYLIPH